MTGTPFNSTLCHCTMCRRATGAPAVAWFSVRSSEFRFVAGRPASFGSSPGITRRFCGDCGTQLTFEDERWPDELDITTASLNDPEAIPPGDHTFMQSHLRWLALADGLPRYSRTRKEGTLQQP
ncbi:GFA family protein [Pseudoduganella plicata]|uniref:GFA family protein n=1 Tax=Pseudoduganella plicata TaxID=321984 RepID=UPI001E3FC3AD|nr:GFA family protein [Pseudoduganella plicata]